MFLILGPVLNLVATLFWEPDTQGATAGTLIGLSSACWLIGLIGIFDRLHASAPRYVAVALPVAVFATVGGVSFGVQAIHETLFSATHAHTVELLNEYPFAATTLFWTAGPLFPATFFALGLVLAWRRAAPLPVGILLCLGALAFPLSRITREASIALVADVLLVLPFLYLGIRGLRPASRPGAAGGSGAGAEQAALAGDTRRTRDA